MEELRLGSGQENRGLEKTFLERCLAGAPEMTLTVLGVPMLMSVSRGAAELLSRRGACCTFRVQGEARDAERFAAALGDFFQAGEEEDLLGLVCAPREQDCFILLDDAHLLDCMDGLGALVQRLLLRCGERVHFLLLSARPIPFIREADALPVKLAEVEPSALILTWTKADGLLREVYPALLESDRQRIFELGGGWLSAMDAAARAMLDGGGDGGSRVREQILSAVSDLLDGWAAAVWTAEDIECMERVCVERNLSETLALRLTDGETGPLRRLARRRFLVRARAALEPVYFLNRVLQSWLYQRAWLSRGKGFLTEQHRIAVLYAQEREDWQAVFYHQLRRGYAEEAALTLRYLSFSEIDVSLLEDYRQLLRRLPPAAIDKLPWVQMGYAIAVKYRYPNIAFRYLDRAAELFRDMGDREGMVLAACQRISMGFFAPEHESAATEPLRILTEEDFQDGELDRVIDGYRKVFTAYALIQQAVDYPRAIALLEQAKETALIRENDNLRLWACFVTILTYKDCRYENGLKSILDEALELVESPVVQKPLKMCLYQTVAFLCYIESGRYAQARDCCERAARIADEIGAYGYSVYINMVHAYALDCLGRFQKAEQVILETARVSSNILNVRNEHLWAYYLIGQSYHYFLKGDPDLAQETADKAVDYARRAGRNSYLVRALLVSGNIAAERGRMEQANALADESMGLCDKRKYRFYQLSTLFLKAQIYRAGGETTRFQHCMEQLAEGGREAGIYHYNFAKPETICRVAGSFRSSERDRSYFLQLEACNTAAEATAAAAPILESRLHTPLEVQILGSLSVRRRGETAEACPSARAAQLLRILALYPEPVSIHKLLVEIWPDWEEKAAMNSFYFTLYQLRAYLGEKNAVVYKRGLCGLDRELVTVDAALFQEFCRQARQYLSAGNLYAAGRYFAQATGLVRGKVLDGDDLPENALIQRESLERFVFTALRDYGTVCMRQHRPDEAEQVLSEAVKSDFADEEAHRLLIRAQYLSGNKSGALSTYERLCRQLQTELQVEPHRLTRELVDRIRHNQEVADAEEPQ